MANLILLNCSSTRMLFEVNISSWVNGVMHTQPKGGLETKNVAKPPNRQQQRISPPNSQALPKNVQIYPDIIVAWRW